MKILHAEDGEDWRILIKRGLEKKIPDLTIEWATDITSALKKYEELKGNFDAIIMDGQLLYGHRGEELAQKLRETWNYQGIILFVSSDPQVNKTYARFFNASIEKKSAQFAVDGILHHLNRNLCPRK